MDQSIHCRVLASGWCIRDKAQPHGKGLARLSTGGSQALVLGRVLVLVVSGVYNRKIKSFLPQRKSMNSLLLHSSFQTPPTLRRFQFNLYPN
jgi:hypothetical protein